VEDFWNDICDLNEDLLGRGLSMLEDCDVDERRLFDISVQLSKDLRLHARDANRKPWEQFLHNGAPGSGIDVSGYGNDGSVQVLPSSAMEILYAALSEYNSTVGAIEAVSNTLGTMSSGRRLTFTCSRSGGLIRHLTKSSR
jgi:hypothetical protein